MLVLIGMKEKLLKCLEHFEGHPNLTKLYLPDGYEGNPMLKSFELISREVKPWPGDVDVEGMPEDSEGDDS